MRRIRRRGRLLQRSSGIVSFAPGVSVNMPISSEILSDRPEAIPRKLQILLQDADETFDSLAAFKAAATAKVQLTSVDGEFEILDADIAHDADLPYANQRITVENISLDMRWSADAHSATKAHISGIVARKEDRLRIIRNRMTYGVVSLFGYGIGVYDLNAIESNDDREKPDGYKAIRELVRLTRADLRPECGWGPGAKPVPPGAIPDLTFTPDAAVITRSGTANLFVYGIDPARGILDVTVHPPVTATDAQNAPDLTVCSERPPHGLTFQTTYATPDGSQTDYDPRINALRNAFFTLAGRYPTGRFTGVSYYHWTLEAKDNKAVGPAPAPDKPIPGARGSIAGERVQRDYLLVPGFEYGLLVVEVGGDPAPLTLPMAGYAPLSPQHLVDIIWIPAGAYAVRAIPRTNLATVLDGDGRVLLVDLSRIDERFNATGGSIASSSLFATAAHCLGKAGAYGIGEEDPRIVWKSDPQPDAVGTLAPVINADTGFVFRGKLLKRSTDVVAAIDPRIQMKCELAQEGGLSEVGGVIPLGIDPPQTLKDLIANGDPSRKADASTAAFRLELSLPGAIAESLAASGVPLRVAVESERVAGAAMPQTPEGLPRSHLRVARSNGLPDPRPASAFVLRRLIPLSQTAQLRHQNGFNKYISPWIVAIADPRAAGEYAWSYPSNVTTEDARKSYRAQQGCQACDRPQFLKGKTEGNDVWELYTNGRLIAVRPDLCGSSCAQNVFTNTKYPWLGQQGRLLSRFATVMADSVRPTAVLTAAQNPPVASGLLQETTYLHSGEVQVDHTDFDFGGRNGWNASVDRTYRSRTIGGTALGSGWDSPLFRRLRPLPNGDVEYRDGEGEQWLFRIKGGNYISPAGLFLRLSRSTSGWRLSDQKHRVTGFDGLGRLIYETDEFVKNPEVSDYGNILRYVYDAEGQVRAVVDPMGRETTLTYGADLPGAPAGMLVRVTDQRRTIDYGYDPLGRLASVKLPDVPNTSGARPAITYGYSSSIDTATDRIELATNLTTITDPGSPAPRVTFVYAPNGELRDRVVQQSWTSTGEVATFGYGSPVIVTDALKQQRAYVLTPGPVDGASDRAHISSLEEREVATSSTAPGELPVSVGLGPQRSLQTRKFSFEYFNDGTLKTAVQDGVRTTSYVYKDAGFGVGVVPDTIETKPATSALGESITKSFQYQSGAEVSSFLQSVTANGSKIDAAEPSPAGEVLDDNDSIKRKTELDAFGRTARVSTSGGTDGSDVGSNLTLSYVPSTAPKYAAGKIKAVTQKDGAESLDTTTDYPDEHTIIETDVQRSTVKKSTIDDWERPVDVAVSEAGSSEPVLHEQYEYDAAGRVRRLLRQQTSLNPKTKAKERKSVATEYAYDAVGRLLSTTINEAAVDGKFTQLTTSTEYQLGARSIVQTSATGNKTTIDLDGAGRTQTRTVAAAPQPIVQEFAYDLAGNQVFSGEKCVASCGAVLTWIGTAGAFDAHGRSTATLNADGTKTTASGFDGWGNPAAVSTLDSTNGISGKSTLSFTPSGRLTTQATDLGTSSLESSSKWDGAGRPTATQASGRLSVSRFDALGRLVSTTAGEGAGTTVASPFYSFKVPPYAYSGSLVTAGAVKEKSAPEVGVSYGFDAVGNATKRTVGELSWQQELDERGSALSSAQPGRSPEVYQYDSRGLVTRDTRPDASELNFHYDAASSMKKYIDPTEETLTENDFLGRPLKRTYPDETTETFGYDGARLWTYKDRQNRPYVYEYDSSGRLYEVRVAGEPVERRGYDSAGRLQILTSSDAAIRFDKFDLGGRPHLTVQTRYRNHSAFTSKEILDEYSQTHDFNEHGERTKYTMPSYSGSAAGWTMEVQQAFDAAGNIKLIERQLSGANSKSVLLEAEYRNAGRPSSRTVTTDCAAAAQCLATSVARSYGYNGNGQMNEMRVVARGNAVAGSHVTFDGNSLQIGQAELIGLSGGRSNFYSYYERGPLKSSVFGRTSAAAGNGEDVDPSDFRHALVRSPAEPADPPSLTFEHAKGHKIQAMTRGAEKRAFSYATGAERTDDGRFTYSFDARGRLVSATEDVKSDSATLRRIVYDYSATDRVVGRRAEYAVLSAPGAPAAAVDWKLEDRAAVLCVGRLAGGYDLRVGRTHRYARRGLSSRCDRIDGCERRPRAPDHPWWTRIR